ncbi:MAG: hypothetical protein OEL66_01235 [Desulfobulbaceae bacterium]|nr:hypothetical protein [Desulfobulbaceae bacterium]
MEKIVEELKSIFTFKDTTEVGDVVLVVAEEPQMILYALVLGIERDRSKRDEWWHVSLQFLTLPPQQTAWTLRAPQFSGQEIFTMAGKKKFIQAIQFSLNDDQQGGGGARTEKKKKSGLRLVK